MNSYIRNQKGYAILVVLLTITMIGIMVPVVMSNIMNSSTQYNETEEDIQLNKLAEMGAFHFEKEAERIKEQTKTSIENMEKIEDDDDVELMFYTYIENSSLNGYEKTITLEENQEQFTITQNTMNRHEDKIVIDYTVSPSLNGGSEQGEPLNETITIRANENDDN
ncbi:hypothetical protein D7Z54_02660 [Salibacterium salarium]|uniref:Type II secretory pathway, pseudopilin PulG n=1 Tax=Salibacterium salarium TaxID=284579 RepID=A0A428N8P1_9BACI|nr:hypothetical protein [Salibacterium salarium]RSL34759.1 hypothetical protein D7Z54_02660 [Salibacterium salarium]